MTVSGKFRRRPLFHLILAAMLTVSSVITGCYNGVARSEEVKILQTEIASTKRVAMLVERGDHAALSGTTIFVFVSDHIYSIPELRKGLYGFDAVFVASGADLRIRWSGINELTIQCADCGIVKDFIKKQRFSVDGVAVKYVGFP